MANRPKAERIAEAVNFAARALGRTQNAADLELAGAAAFNLAARFCQGSITEPDGSDPLLPADTEDNQTGLGLLTIRVHQDSKAPGGVIGSDAYAGGIVPLDLWAHIGDYFAGDMDVTRVIGIG